MTINTQIHIPRDQAYIRQDYIASIYTQRVRKIMNRKTFVTFKVGGRLGCVVITRVHNQ